MITFPNAKINIGLNIIEKRSDGFHNLQSVFYPIGLCDALEIVENTEQTNELVVFTSTGIEIPGKAEDNLCCKAYHLIAQDYALPKIKIHLHKHIPIGAGLGGGSADAAFFILLMNDKFELGISWGEMHHYARLLGSDCSFFVSNKPAYAQSKGDDFESINLDLSNLFVAVVYPNIHINTASAYSKVKPQLPLRSLEEEILNLPMKDWKNHIKNDFEISVFAQYPEIKNIKEQLYHSGAVYASMSGSGSSLFGLFHQETDLQTEFPDYFIWQGKLN